MSSSKAGENEVDPSKVVRALPIREWDSDIQCKKCDTKKDEDVGGTGPGVSVNWYFSNGDVQVNGVTADIFGIEVLKCHCRRCGFEWLMHTSDAEERAEAEKARLEAEREKVELEAESKEPAGKKFKGHAVRVPKEA